AAQDYTSQGRRGRLPARRRSAVLVRVSMEEKQWLQAKAAAAGWSVPRLLIESVKAASSGESIATTKTVIDELVGVRRLLAHNANNINQIAAAVNSGQPLAAGQLTAEVGGLRRLMDRCTDAIQDLSA